MNTQIIYINRQGREMTHTLGARVTKTYANNLFFETIVSCQGVLSEQEKRDSKFRLVAIRNTVE